MESPTAVSNFFIGAFSYQTVCPWGHSLEELEEGEEEPLI